MIIVKYIPNILSQEGRTLGAFAFDRSKTIKEYLSEAKINYKNCRIIVSGKAVEDLGLPVDNDDEILVTPKVEAPVIAAVVKFIVTYWAIISTVIMVAYSIYQASAMRKRLANFGSNGEGLDESSPTYGWEGIINTQEVGIPVSVIYGEHKFGGNIINQYISTDGENNYLNVLLALCEGGIESISDIKINDNPIANFEGVDTYTRLGTNDQSVIPNFEDLHNLYTINIELTQNNAYTYTTIDQDVEAFEIHLNLPAGLYYQDPQSGNISSWAVSYRIEYKLHTSGTWIDLGITTINVQSQSALYRVFSKTGLAAGQYDIRITRTSADSSTYYAGDLFLQSIDEIKTDDLAYPNTALLGIKALATNQLSGATPKFTSVIKGKKVLVPQIMYNAAEVAWEDYYWDSDSFEYKLLSNDGICAWDGTTYIERWCANPIWCLKDLLLNNRCGLGQFIDVTQIDTGEMLTMSRVCEERVSDGDGGYEKRFRMDVVLDSPAKALDALVQLCATFGAFPFYSNGAVSFRIDKAESATQVFGMGNIIVDSFQQSWKSIKDIYNIIEVKFMAKDLDYKDETVVITDEAALSAGDPVRKASLRLFVTRKSYAIRQGRYALWISKYINRSIVFRAGIDSIACQPGDRIDVSHDVPQWGFSGRVQPNSTTILVKLDQTIVIEADKTYKIMVRFSDDTIQEKTVSDGPGSYSEVHVTSAFSQVPQSFNVYAFGESNKVVKPFRVIGIRRENKGEAEISAIEYNESIYDDSGVVLPTNNYSILNFAVPNVTNFNLTERIVLMGDGSIEDEIDAWWQNPVITSYNVKQYANARIYLSDNDGASWIYKGESLGESFAILGGIITGVTYKIAVTSVSDAGEETPISTSPQLSITVQGQLAPPSDVTGFEVYQQGYLLHMNWNANTDPDLARYIIKKGSEWSTAVFIAELIDTTEFLYPVGEIGLLNFMIKAVDTSNNESVNPDIDQIEVIPPPEMNFINDYDVWSNDFKYLLNNLELIWANYHNGNFARPCLSLRTATTWEEREAEAQTWEYQETNAGLILDTTFETSGYYEMKAPIDLGTIFEFVMVLDADFKNVANGSVTIQVSYSEDGITYTAFADVDTTITYRAKYLKFKFILATTDANYKVELYDCKIYINAPVTMIAYGSDVLIPDTGKTIEFGVTFQYPPLVNTQIINGIVGFCTVDNKTVTSFEVEVRNPAQVLIGTAEINWTARGY